MKPEMMSGSGCFVSLRWHVGALRRIVTAEQSLLGIELESCLHDVRRVCVAADVVVMDLVVRQEIVDDAAKVGDVGAGSDGTVEIGDSRRPREARIDDDQLRTIMMLCLRHPFEAARMRFCGVAAHDDDDIRILDVGPVVGHRTTPKRRSQTGHRR